MQLLFIPVVLAVAGFWFNHRERKAAELRAENERKTAELHAEADREISLDNQREAALKEYICFKNVLKESLGKTLQLSFAPNLAMSRLIIPKFTSG